MTEDISCRVPINCGGLTVWVKLCGCNSEGLIE